MHLKEINDLLHDDQEIAVFTWGLSYNQSLRPEESMILKHVNQLRQDKEELNKDSEFPYRLINFEVSQSGTVNDANFKGPADSQIRDSRLSAISQVDNAITGIPYDQEISRRPQSRKPQGQKKKGDDGIDIDKYDANYFDSKKTIRDLSKYLVSAMAKERSHPSESQISKFLHDLIRETVRSVPYKFDDNKRPMKIVGVGVKKNIVDSVKFENGHIQIHISILENMKDLRQTAKTMARDICSHKTAVNGKKMLWGDIVRDEGLIHYSVFDVISDVRRNRSKVFSYANPLAMSKSKRKLTGENSLLGRDFDKIVFNRESLDQYVHRLRRVHLGLPSAGQLAGIRHPCLFDKRASRAALADGIEDIDYPTTIIEDEKTKAKNGSYDTGTQMEEQNVGYQPWSLNVDNLDLLDRDEMDDYNREALEQFEECREDLYEFYNNPEDLYIDAAVLDEEMEDDPPEGDLPEDILPEDDLVVVDPFNEEDLSPPKKRIFGNLDYF